MKRKVLFRGQKVSTNEWVNGDLLCNNPSVNRGGHTQILSGYIFHQVIDKTISLFICLSDKNRKKIFEGDIIKYYGKILLVEYDLVSGVKLRVLNKPFSDSFTFDSSSILKKRAEIEIIGNKFDNPEMLVS